MHPLIEAFIYVIVFVGGTLLGVYLRVHLTPHKEVIVPDEIINSFKTRLNDYLILSGTRGRQINEIETKYQSDLNAIRKSAEGLCKQARCKDDSTNPQRIVCAKPDGTMFYIVKPS